MEDIEEGLAGRVGMVALALAHVFGQVQWQWPVGPTEAEEELLQARRLVAVGADRGQGRRGEPAVQALAQAHWLVGQAQGMAEAWQLGVLRLEAAQRLEEVVRPRLVLHGLQGVHKVGLRPGLAAQRMISPRSLVRSTVSVKLLIDT
ncbi:hypothetical protein D3C78_1400480 [compost metagenome]